MSDIKTGGPAFPVLSFYAGADGNLHPTPSMYGGMTLRDWFAGQALAGMLADNERGGKYSAFALDAYGFADAMLKVREGSND